VHGIRPQHNTERASQYYGGRNEEDGELHQASVSGSTD
jgi:hypothetical protein